jgi:hypothetical protein
MDVQTIDQEYQQLQTQAQGTTQEIRALADKLQNAAQGGNQDAREWLLDLKSIALAFRRQPLLSAPGAAGKPVGPAAAAGAAELSAGLRPAAARRRRDARQFPEFRLRPRH